MNTQTLKGNWNLAKGKLKQKYAQLTDDDLNYTEGMEDEMIGRIQSKLGKDRSEVEAMVRQACENDPVQNAFHRDEISAASGHVDMPMRKPSSGTAAADASEARPNAGNIDSSAAHAGERSDARQQGASTAQTRLKGNAASMPPPMPPKPSYPSTAKR